MDKFRPIRRRYTRDWIDALKNKPCMDCGRSFPAVCMDFDHNPGKIKSFEISTATDRTQEAILLEIAKCDLVCSNCHRLRTQTRLDRIDTTGYRYISKKEKMEATEFGCGHARSAENILLRRQGTVRECRFCWNAAARRRAAKELV